MKISILNKSKQSIGGGWTFIRNFKEGLERVKEAEYVEDWRQSDIVLIPSASMVSRDDVDEVKKLNKKVVLRVDNIPRNSRNRGAGTSRLYDIAQLADSIIYQSKWSKDYIMPFIKKYGRVIYNGIDTELFHPDKSRGAKNFGNYDRIYLYSRYNRDETKMWERVWFDYQMIHRSAKEKGNTVKLVLTGRFSDDLRKYDFDFYTDEVFEYIGVIESPREMAQVMRGCHVLLAPYYNDCYSNTIQEAMATGLELRVDLSGGTPELLQNGVIDRWEMVSNYIEYFNELLQGSA